MSRTSFFSCTVEFFQYWSVFKYYSLGICSLDLCFCSHTKKEWKKKSTSTLDILDGDKSVGSLCIAAEPVSHFSCSFFSDPLLMRKRKISGLTYLLIIEEIWGQSDQPPCVILKRMRNLVPYLLFFGFELQNLLLCPQWFPWSLTHSPLACECKIIH